MAEITERDRAELRLALVFLADALASVGLPQVEPEEMPEIGSDQWAARWVAIVRLAIFRAWKAERNAGRSAVLICAVELEGLLLAKYPETRC